MADLYGGQGLDTNQVQDTFEALPAGEYPVRIVDSEVKVTNDGHGQYLNLKIQVDDGPCKGRVFFDKINLKNANPKAVAIGQSMLKRLVKATGAPTHIRDSAELHNLPFIAVTKVDRDDKFGDKAVLKSCKPYGQAAAPAQQQAPAAAPAQQPAPAAPPAQQPAAGGGMPWNT